MSVTIPVWALLVGVIAVLVLIGLIRARFAPTELDPFGWPATSFAGCGWFAAALLIAFVCGCVYLGIRIGGGA